MRVSPQLSTRIIAIGNTFRGDDGAGLCVAELLRQQAPERVEILEASGEGTCLMQAWAGAETVILVDAVRSGARPGTIHRVDASTRQLPAGLVCCSTHAFGLAEAIELARALANLPPRMIVFGIEGRDFSAGEGLTPEVEAAAQEVANRILAECRMAAAAAIPT